MQLALVQRRKNVVAYLCGATCFGLILALLNIPKGAGGGASWFFTFVGSAALTSVILGALFAIVPVRKRASLIAGMSLGLIWLLVDVFVVRSIVTSQVLPASIATYTSFLPFVVAGLISGFAWRLPDAT